MIDNDKMITVLNKSNGMVAYELPELNNLYRTFGPGETKTLTFNELRMLSYKRGGDVLLQDYLTIFDTEAVAELVGDVEPEYYYTRKEVEALLLNGSLDQLEDCLNFAPKGICELVKDMAIELKINAVDKRKLIGDKFGVNLDRMIEIGLEDEVEQEPIKPVVRKATAKVATADAVVPTPVRKTTPVKIVSKKEEA